MSQKHKTKVYACFVDFRKTFDSVWHDGLLYKLLQINVRGNFYKVIKSLYSNSTCSIRVGNNQTQPFQYTRGVRQSCILSPLLFNLYVNDLAFSFNNILSDPFVLPNGTKLNSLFYADDLIILSPSKLGLQNCLHKLSSYCNSWMLKIDSKKTKIMVFQKGTKKCDYVFHIGNEMIDIVHCAKRPQRRRARRNGCFRRLAYASRLPEILPSQFGKKPSMLYLV